MNVLLLIIGLLLLVVGGELLVRGAVSLARKFNISSLVIAMTIVALGTSAPELVVSIKAALAGHSDIAVGNVIGSNIANIGLVLGITAMIYPIKVNKNSIRYDWPMMMFASLLTFGLMANGLLSRKEGVLMLFILIVFNIALLKFTGKVPEEIDEDEELQTKREKSYPLKKYIFDFILIISGCLLLAYGADLMLDGAIELAKKIGVSDLAISVTVVAFGTSAPELVTSVVAAIKKETDISVGNLIGSNIFNLLAILGFTSIVQPIHPAELALNRGMWWVVGIAAILFPIMVLGKKISRIEGFFLVLLYGSYVFLVLNV